MCDDDGDGFCQGDPPEGRARRRLRRQRPRPLPGRPRDLRQHRSTTTATPTSTRAARPARPTRSARRRPRPASAASATSARAAAPRPTACSGPIRTTMIPGTMGRCDTFGNGCSACVRCATPTATASARAPGGQRAARAGDCNDDSAAQAPGLKEICGNGLDDDCNGTVDDLCNDCDGDDDCPRDLLVCRNGACAACARGCTAGAACTYDIDGTPTGGQVRGASGGTTAAAAASPRVTPTATGTARATRPAASRAATAGPTTPTINPDVAEICGNEEDDNCNGLTDEGCTRCTAHAGCPNGSACVDRTCESCDTTCEVAECRFGADENVPGSGVAGRCAAFATGCQRCVPTCDVGRRRLLPGGRATQRAARAATATTRKIDVIRTRRRCAAIGSTTTATAARTRTAPATTCASSAMCGANESCSTDR